MLLKNGKVLIKDKIEQVDIKIEKEKIIEIGENLKEDGSFIDLKGAYVVPGGIDVHTHFNIDVGVISADDFQSGSMAALAGGTTTIIDHPGFGPKGCNLEYMIDKYMDYAKNSLCDYSFHGVFQEVDKNSFKELEKLKKRGINSFKIYLTYSFKQEDEDIIKVFQYAKNLDMIVAVHAENDSIISFFKKKYMEERKGKAIYHAYSRPSYSEAEAVSRLIRLAETVEFEKLYFVHISSKESLDEIIQAKLRGRKFWVETCTQYLYLNELNYLEDGGEKYILSPPLRKEEDIKALWKGIDKNYIDIIATDHCSFSLEQKRDGINEFWKCPNGIPGVQERVLLIFSEFLKGKLSVEKYLNLTSKKPAEIFGMSSRKGSIEIGKDADLVIFKEKKLVLNSKMLFSKANYSCFDGFKLLADIDMVFLRGELVHSPNLEEVKLNKIGKFIPRY